jgi:cytosolic carboxypeptidase protein 2/3
VGEKEYHLFMRADTNTRGHHQWFYFRVKNRLTQTVTLVLRNFSKGSMLYRRGLRPFARSKIDGHEHFSQISQPVTF